MEKQRAHSALAFGSKRLNQTLQSDTQIRVAKVSQAKFYEPFRVIPKFTHIPLAVINPSPKKMKPSSEIRAHSMDVFTNKVRLRQKLNPIR